MDGLSWNAAPKNVAAWSLQSKTRPLVVGNAAYTSPPSGCLVIRVFDVAINPIDFKMQDSAPFPLKYPNVFGTDVAGEIVELGDNVDNRFKKGGRVIAHMDSYTSNDPSRGAFQRFAVARAVATCPLPWDIPSATGVVLPLSISTASAGLFQKGYLSLPLPINQKDSESTSKDKDKDKDKPRVLLIWGGSSSIGSSAIQLAHASSPSLEIITTSSESNFSYCSDLGATQTFDYHSSTVEKDIIKYCKDKTIIGAYHAAGTDAAILSCANILNEVDGKAIVVTVTGTTQKDIPGSVRVKRISSGNIFDEGNEVGRQIWQNFLPQALEDKVIRPKPDPWVIGQELRSVQKGIDESRKGVSAKKIVVSNIPSTGK